MRPNSDSIKESTLLETLRRRNLGREGLVIVFAFCFVAKLLFPCLFSGPSRRPDHVPGVHGSAAQHDLPVRPRHVPNVRRSHVRVPHLPQSRREAHSPLLIIR